MSKMLGRIIGEDIILEIHTMALQNNLMTDSGQLTADIFLDKRYAESSGEIIPGPYIMFAVTDTGTGISPEVKEKIFDLFFTT